MLLEELAAAIIRYPFLFVFSTVYPASSPIIFFIVSYEVSGSSITICESSIPDAESLYSYSSFLSPSNTKVPGILIVEFLSGIIVCQPGISVTVMLFIISALILPAVSSVITNIIITA